MGFANISIHQVAGGEKEVSPRKELTLAVGKGVGEGETGSSGTGIAHKELRSLGYGWAVGSQEPEGDKKRRLLGLDGAWLRDLGK